MTAYQTQKMTEAERTLWNNMLKRSFSPRQWFALDDLTTEGEEEKIMWVYRKQTSPKTGESVFVVGFYSPDREWHADTAYREQREAAARVNYLNGGRSVQE
jgi:hypothetical protein